MHDDLALYEQLAPTAERLLERHLETSKEWFPHELIPWERGRNFVDGEQWQPDTCALPDGVRSALFVNLLTEDNLPYYFRDVERMFGRDGAFGEWVRRWTAEEGRHSTVLRDYLTVTRIVDPVALERARMVQVQSGQVPEPENAIVGAVYLCIQELATRIAHRNTGKLLDEDGYAVMAKVATDENRHHLFYRDLARAAIELAPSRMVQIIEEQVRTFDMPGTGIPDFTAHSHAIARAGIYDFLVHYEQILVPVVLRNWGIEELTGLSSEAEVARDALLKHIERTGRVGRRLAEQRSAA